MMISDNAGYKVFCEKRKINVGDNDNYVRIYSTFDGSRDPEYQQTKLEMFLTDEQLELLRQALA